MQKNDSVCLSGVRMSGSGGYSHGAAEQGRKQRSRGSTDASAAHTQIKMVGNRETHAQDELMDAIWKANVVGLGCRINNAKDII
jgi:hypothetical protein